MNCAGAEGARRVASNTVAARRDIVWNEDAFAGTLILEVVFMRLDGEIPTEGRMPRREQIGRGGQGVVGGVCRRVRSGCRRPVKLSRSRTRSNGRRRAA